MENSDETHLFAVYYIEYAQSTGAISFVMGSMVSWEKMSSSNNGHFWDPFSRETIDLTRPTLTYSESASKTTLGINSSARSENFCFNPCQPAPQHTRLEKTVTHDISSWVIHIMMFDIDSECSHDA